MGGGMIPPPMNPYIQSFLPLFVAINVLRIIPVYLALTERMTAAQRRRLTLPAAATSSLPDALLPFPAPLALPERMAAAQRRRLALLAVATSSLLATLILFAGQLIFSLLGITVNDLRVGGGLILLVLSISNLIFGDYRRRDPRGGGGGGGGGG